MEEGLSMVVFVVFITIILMSLLPMLFRQNKEQNTRELPIGFRNNGSLCYLNATIQCLLSSQNFVKSLKHSQKTPESQELYRIYKNKIPSINPKKILNKTTRNKLKIMEGQQDSHEFLILLLEQLERKTQKLFESDFSLTTKCLGCQYSTKNISKSGIISIHPTCHNLESKLIRSSEIIYDWKCDSCKMKNKVEKIEKYLNTPKILVFHILKWKNTKKNNKITKNYPVQIFSKKLIGFIVHIGSYSTNGHYVAFIKRNNQWYLADDESIESIPYNNILKQLPKAYLLFYENNTK